MAVAGIVTCAATRGANAAEREPTAANKPAGASTASTETSGAVEGPAYPPPPNPEEVKRIDDLTKALADSEARAGAAEDAAQRQIADEHAQREALKARIETMESSLAAISKRAEAAPPVTTTRTGLSLGGFLQSDMIIRQSAQDQLNPAGAPLNTDRFFIKRARLRATLDREYIAGAVEFDGNTVNGPTARILGAEASVRWPASSATNLAGPLGGFPEPPATTPLGQAELRQRAVPLLMATVGSFKIPFGFEVGQSDRDRLFLERSTAERAFFPGEYDLGARLMGGWRFVRYSLALMNGEPLGETSSFLGRDPNHQKDFVGRVGVETSIVDRLGIAAGVSGLAGTGFHPGTPATKPTLIWQDRNQDGMFQPNEVSASAGVAATPSSSFTRQAIGFDLELVGHILPIGATTAYGEVYLAKNLDRGISPADPRATGRDLNEVGSYVAFTQELFRHGMIGFRYDYYNPDKDSTDVQAAVLVPQDFAYQTFAFAGGLQAASGRLIVEYDANRNHLGRDTNGLPTNLKDNAFLLRGEVKF